MKYVIFQNQGELDPRLIKTFGISAKENDNPIGYFGTGLKYAIAICLRLGIKIEIYSGDKEFIFTKGQVQARSQDFEIVVMNGEELSFTTRLGQNWELWQAFREIYCNCLDEKGDVFISEKKPMFTAGATYIVLEGFGVEDLFHTKGKIVLNLPESLRVLDGPVQIYKDMANHMYYRGIRVYDFGKPSLYTYNVTETCTLTEDRTIKFPYIVTPLLPRAISRLRDKGVIKSILTASEAYAESGFNFYHLSFDDDQVTKEFMEVLGDQYHDNNDRLNRTAITFFVKKTDADNFKSRKAAELTLVEAQKLARARLVCKKLYPDFDKYPILVVGTLGQLTHGMADIDKEEIIVSKEAFAVGTKYLVSTLIEEYLHLKTGYQDCSRELQTYLFDKIVTMAEEHVLLEPI